MSYLQTYYKVIIDLFATGFYSGKFPIAPGTAGTLAAAILSAIIFPFFPQCISIPFGIIFVGAFSLFSVFIANEALRLQLYGTQKDPKQIVIDEFAGYLAALLGLGLGYQHFITAFILFRLFDITKPPPVGNLEKLPRGWGIVMDDVMAGIISNVLARVILAFFGA